MLPLPVLPPLDLSLLFDELVNFHMQKNPTLPVFVYADDRASDHHVTEISFLEFGRAAHRIARVLRPERDGNEGQVVMLIANCDTILFHAAVVGMIVAGLVPFSVSHRNSAPAVIDMMRKTNCSRIVTLHHAHSDLIENVRELAGCGLVIDELPTLSFAFPNLGNEVEADPFVSYPASTSRPDLDSPMIYLHSSGSTGFPKPIPLNHKVQMGWMTNAFMLTFKRLPVSSRVGVMALPAFHAFGTGVQLFAPFACLVAAVVCAPRAVSDPHAAPVIPTTSNVLDYARWTECKALMTVPTFLEQWAVSREDVEELKKLEIVVYAGGPLAERIGDDLWAAGVALTTCYGGTEVGCVTHIRLKSEIEDGDWKWMRFWDGVKINWVPYGDDAYECQVLSTENYPVALKNLPNVEGCATSDLFVKHPTKDLWRIVGRADDVIILASGEKTVPAPMENIINSSPLIQGSIMFGRERNQVGIIVEPQPEHAVDIRDENAVVEFRNKIWPLVDEANKTAPAFSRIFKEMILITSPNKPILRTPKESMQRKATIKSYEAEIDALYNVVEAVSLNGFAGPSAWTEATLEGWLTEQANTISRGHNIDPQADLFAQGFDSLSVTYLRNQLVEALRRSPESRTREVVSRISLNIIFENPTIERLAARIASLVDERGGLHNRDSKRQHVAAINAMIEKYSSGLHGPAAATNGALQDKSRPARAVVLLTGSTGGLGSFLLAQLISNPAVERVYAFNRPSSTSSMERQRSVFVDRGLSVDLLKSEKLVYLEADASQDGCGLSSTLHEELRGKITTVIHNAWRLDFNLSLTSFESSIKATRNLVDLALNAHYAHSLRFVFTSSVSSAQSWNRERGAFPEEVQLDPSTAVGSGYGESKYVCERILVNSGLRATTLRIGQISGGPNGSWAATDWVPIIVKSSIALGAFPKSQGVVSWMRAEDVAESILDVAFAEDDVPQALNIVNPQRPCWNAIMSSIRDSVLKQKSASLASKHLMMVPFLDWVALLEKRADGATPEDLVDIPAIKLLEFFRRMAKKEELAQAEIQAKGSLQIVETGGMVDFSTVKAQQISRAVAHMQPVGDMDTHAWVRYWSLAGLF